MFGGPGIVTIFLLGCGRGASQNICGNLSLPAVKRKKHSKQTSSSIIVGTELLANCVGYFMNLTIRTNIDQK